MATVTNLIRYCHLQENMRKRNMVGKKTDLVINVKVLEETLLPSCTNMDGMRQSQRRNVYE
jgi:hypothetical protein